MKVANSNVWQWRVTNLWWQIGGSSGRALDWSSECHEFEFLWSRAILFPFFSESNEKFGAVHWQSFLWGSAADKWPWLLSMKWIWREIQRSWIHIPARTNFLKIRYASSYKQACSLVYSTAYVRADWLLDLSLAAKWEWLLITYLVAVLSNPPKI